MMLRIYIATSRASLLPLSLFDKFCPTECWPEFIPLPEGTRCQGVRVLSNGTMQASLFVVEFLLFSTRCTFSSPSRYALASVVVVVVDLTGTKVVVEPQTGRPSPLIKWKGESFRPRNLLA